MRCDKKTTLNLGSSETTRETPLFKNHNLIFLFIFKTLCQTTSKITDVKFLQWFIGFSEVMVLLLFLKPIVALL
jgi:hypothetical protein